MFNRGKRRKATQVTKREHLVELAQEGKPILVDFFQFGCAPCQVMDGIVDEIADEVREAEVVKINVGRAPWAVEEFRIQSTPTFMVIAPPSDRAGTKGKLRSRWRTSGLVKKDALIKAVKTHA